MQPEDGTEQAPREADKTYRLSMTQWVIFVSIGLGGALLYLVLTDPGASPTWFVDFCRSVGLSPTPQ